MRKPRALAASSVGLLIGGGCASLLGLDGVAYRDAEGGGGAATADASGGTGTGGFDAPGGAGGAGIATRVAATVVAGSEAQRGLGVAVGDNDRVYLLGEFSGNVVGLPTLPVNAPGPPDTLLVSFNGDLTPVWTRTFGGEGRVPAAMAVDASSVFVAATNGSRNLDLGEAGAITPAPCVIPETSGTCLRNDVVAFKYDLDFDLRWWRAGGVANGDERSEGIAILDGDPVFLASYARAQSLFGLTLPDVENRTGLVVRLRDETIAGADGWVTPIGNPNRRNIPRAIAADGDDVGALVNTDNASGVRGLDLHRLGPDGTPSWTDAVSWEGHADGRDLTADGDGGFVLAARLLAPISGPVAVSPVGDADGVLIHVGDDRSAEVVAQFEGDVRHLCLAATAAGGWVVGGSFVGDLGVGPPTTTLGGDPVATSGFVLELDAAGQLAWSPLTFAGSDTGEVEVRDLALAPNGDILVTGSWRGGVNFAGTLLESVPAAGSSDAPDAAYDAYVQRYRRPAAP
ncbi:MAG: hypothetical protein AAGN82_09675 [Myxococcota bacterium]